MAKFNYLGEAEVSRTEKGYKVILFDAEMEVNLNESFVNSVKEKTGEDENMISILLAYIDCVRRNYAKQKPPRRLDEEIVTKTVAKFLETMLIENLIEQVKQLKWHQLKEVLLADNPIEVLNEI